MNPNQSFYLGPHGIRVSKNVKVIPSIDGVNKQTISDDFESYSEKEMMSPGKNSEEFFSLCSVFI